MRAIAVIPARHASTRFPGKPLAPIAGRPMIQWVWEAARSAPGVDEVVVATDDERILRAVHDFDGRVVLTHPDLPSGTDRVAAALDQLDEDARDFAGLVRIPIHDEDDRAIHAASLLPRRREFVGGV